MGAIKPNEVTTVVTSPDNSGNYLSAGTGGESAGSLTDSGTPAIDQLQNSAPKEPKPARSTAEMQSPVWEGAKGAVRGATAGFFSLVSAIPLIGRVAEDKRDQLFKAADLDGTWTETITNGSAQVGIGAVGTLLSGGTNHVATVATVADKLDAAVTVTQGVGQVVNGNENGAAQVALGIVGVRGGGKAGNALADHVPKSGAAAAKNVAEESSEKLQKATSSVAKNGETAATHAGRNAHKAYRAGEVLDEVRLKEFRLPSGNRIDFIDFERKIIYELKPNNPRAIKLGQQQLAKYLEEVEALFGKGWQTILDTY